MPRTNRGRPRLKVQIILGRISRRNRLDIFIETFWKFLETSSSSLLEIWTTSQAINMCRPGNFQLFIFYFPQNQEYRIAHSNLEWPVGVHRNPKESLDFQAKDSACDLLGNLDVFIQNATNYKLWPREKRRKIEEGETINVSLNLLRDFPPARNACLDYLAESLRKEVCAYATYMS